MTLSLSEYCQLPRGIQSALLLKEGVPLMWRVMMGKHHAVLYSLGAFYVEASWDKEWTLKYLHPFRNVNELNPYLALIDWEEFA
ncbi:hypothetical protein ACFSUS_03000 [Spirosoma soli]|uniref:Uncharacterized protein n=2 Tax=Spirosoma soli TaxID=1770529 RepID=A0ABW5LZ40_9BACT